MTRARKTAEAALEKKGFVREDGDHHYPERTLNITVSPALPPENPAVRLRVCAWTVSPEVREILERIVRS